MNSDIARQLGGIWLSFLFGIFFYPVYDILRIWRLICKPRKTAVFISDLSFMAAAAVVTFILSFSTNYGMLRLYHLLGMGMGFCLSYFTVGKLIWFAAKTFLKPAKIIAEKLKKWFSKAFSGVKNKKRRRRNENKLKKG